jgi:hypothetical protein
VCFFLGTVDSDANTVLDVVRLHFLLPVRGFAVLSATSITQR